LEEGQWAPAAVESVGLAWLAVPDSASNPSVDAGTPHNHIAKRRMLVTTKTEFHNQFTVQCGAQHTTSWSIKELDVDEAHMYYLTRMTIYEDLAYHLRGTHHSQHNLCLEESFCKLRIGHENLASLLLVLLYQSLHHKPQN
jgi:hypothetical protein